MRIIDDEKLDYSDVLIIPKRSTLTSRKEVSLERSFTFKWGGQWSGIPIIAANMDGVGTFSMAKSLLEFKCITALTKHYSTEEYLKFYESLKHIDINNFVDRGVASAKRLVMYSLGSTPADLKKFREVYTNSVFKGANMVCIDVANGYSQAFVDFVREFREQHPELIIAAGNVVTPDMTEELILSGVDIVKIGIGPGSVCTTRKITGVGYPQLSAVIECADAAHGLGGHIIADGGCQVPGDVAKAFGAGADFVMLGGMLAGHDEAEMGAEPVFYGMSSELAQSKHGGIKDYRASEGKVVRIEPKGPIKHTIKEILGGLRSTCTYVGALNLKQLPKRTTFIRVNRQLNQMFD